MPNVTIFHLTKNSALHKKHNANPIGLQHAGWKTTRPFKQISHHDARSDPWWTWWTQCQQGHAAMLCHMPSSSSSPWDSHCQCSALLGPSLDLWNCRIWGIRGNLKLCYSRQYDTILFRISQNSMWVARTLQLWVLWLARAHRKTCESLRAGHSTIEVHLTSTAAYQLVPLRQFLSRLMWWILLLFTERHGKYASLISLSKSCVCVDLQRHLVLRRYVSEESVGCIQYHDVSESVQQVQTVKFGGVLECCW